MPKQHPFFIRLKDNRLIEWGKKSKKPLKDFFVHLPLDEERALYAKINELNLLVVGKKIKGDYVMICSNVQNPNKVLKRYKSRWNIERCFLNMKSQGFNLENTHMTLIPRLMKLMAVVAVAMLLASLAGVCQKCAYKKTVRAPLYSFFTKGLRFLKHNLWVVDVGKYLSLCLTFLKSEG